MGRVLAVTLGEPAGIGPDITLALWHAREHRQLPPFYVVGEAAFLHERARRLGLDVPIAEVEPETAAAAFSSHLPVVPLGLSVTAEPGVPDASSAPTAIASIRRAVGELMQGRAGAVVTNPIAKSVLYRNGFTDPGHTEYLARLATDTTGAAVQPVMMLWARSSRSYQSPCTWRSRRRRSS